MNEDQFIYANFANGNIYALNDAKITYNPNQGLFWKHMGQTQSYGHICATGAPMKLSTEHVMVLEDRSEFILTFKNNIPSEFFHNPFYVNGIEFKLVRYSYSDWECEAVGVLKTK